MSNTGVTRYSEAKKLACHSFTRHTMLWVPMLCYARVVGGDLAKMIRKDTKKYILSPVCTRQASKELTRAFVCFLHKRFISHQHLGESVF